jgi:hypothetical protein
MNCHTNLTYVSDEMVIFLAVAPCSLVSGYRRENLQGRNVRGEESA